MVQSIPLENILFRSEICNKIQTKNAVSPRNNNKSNAKYSEKPQKIHLETR